jgi:hypothetical protein
MLERFLPASVVGPEDRRALRRFASNCLSEIIFCICWLFRLFITMRDRETAVAAGVNGIAPSGYDKAPEAAYNAASR